MTAAEPEVVVVPLPYGLAAHYVMKPRPKPPRPWPGATTRAEALAALTPEQRAAMGLPADVPPPWEQSALDALDKPEAGAPCPF